MARTKQCARKAVKFDSETGKYIPRKGPKDPMVRYFNGIRASVIEANPGASEQEINVIMRQMWSTSEEREAMRKAQRAHQDKDLLNSVPGDHSNLSEAEARRIHKLKLKFMDSHRDKVKADNPEADKSHVHTILNKMWMESNEIREALGVPIYHLNIEDPDESDKEDDVIVKTEV